MYSHCDIPSTGGRTGSPCSSSHVLASAAAWSVGSTPASSQRVVYQSAMLALALVALVALVALAALVTLVALVELVELAATVVLAVLLQVGNVAMGGDL
jgi:hypothetical protein